MTTFTDTYNRVDIQRVYASFSADYRAVAEWTELRTPDHITKVISQVKVLAEYEYLKEVHIQLKNQFGGIRQAAVYRISTNASGWSSDRPGSMYWDYADSDQLTIVVYYSDKWNALSEAEKDDFRARYMAGWGSSDFNGSYPGLTQSYDRRYASRNYGMERTSYK